MLVVTLRWTSIPSRGAVEIVLVASCYTKTGIRSGCMGRLALNVDLTLSDSSHTLKIDHPIHPKITY